MKAFASATATLALTLSTASALSASELRTLDSSGVTSLLSEWELDAVFAKSFADVKLDGEALLRSTPAELKDAFPTIPALHWKRLLWKLEDARAETKRAVKVDAEGGVQRRRLDSHMPLQGTTGIAIESDSASVTMGADMDVVIKRTDDGLQLGASEVNVTKDLRVTGKIIHGGYEDVAATVDDLVGAVDSIEDDVNELLASSAASFNAVQSAAGSSALGHSAANPARSCRYILQMGGAKTNGHYWINRDGDVEPYIAYCNMDRGGLELVFKLNAHGGGTGQGMWEDTSGDYNATSDMHPYLSDNHYVSPLKDSTWDSAGDKFNSITAAIEIGGREEVFVTFKTEGTDEDSWFGMDYVIDSSWSDLLNGTYNFFSIAGHGSGVNRNFYINSGYGGCAVDNGWMGVVGRSSGCTWEITSTPPLMMFAPYGNKAAADGGIDGWQHGDTFVVWVDYDRVYASCRDALLKSDFRAQDGQYWINHDGLTDNQLVYCDMENGGYELVFKLVTAGACSPRVFGDNYGSDDGFSQGCDLWTSKMRDWPNQIGRNVDLHDETGEYASGEHYLSRFRHRAFDISDITVDHIEVRLMVASSVVKFMHFSDFGTADYDEWFGLDYLRTASWNDMFDEDNYNYFSIVGHASAGRCFFANSQYGGCSVDGGWMVVAARSSSACGWENKWTYPDVMYSTTNGELVADDYALADSMAIFYNWHSDSR